MGNLMNNYCNNVPTKRTENGNILYEFQRVTKEELSRYRIGSYGYIL